MEENSVENSNKEIKGLTSAEVAARVKAGQVNGDQTIKTKSVGRIILSHTLTYFNLVFVIIAVILAVFTGFDADGIGNYGFVILVIFNSMVGIVQELNAKRTMDKLSLISAPKVIVIRDGVNTDIAVKDIVLDDVMVLTSGCQICADGIVTDGEIEVNESLITGEPDAIVKRAGDEIMSGSYVVSGKAEAKVVHVAMDNFVMKISAGAKYFKNPTSEIKISLSKIIKIMSFVIVPLGIALFCVKYYVQPGEVNSVKLNNTVVTTMGTLVGLIPSGLVALSTAVFALSVIRLAKHKTLAQDMYCVETLARVDVLCLDKTGTITEGTMEVHDVKTSIDEDEFKQILRNLTAALPDDNATSNAIKAYVAEKEVTMPATAIVPFSSVRKWSGASFDNKTYVMGAPEFVFKNQASRVSEMTEDMAQQGLRVLVVAESDASFDGHELPSDLKPLAMIFIADKIRKEAPDTLKYFREQGVNVKIISGDNPVTVRAVARRAGLENCEDIIDMSTLKTEEEVWESATKYTIFGRVLPDQKLILVKALKAAGHTVAMTGDGVNDVLALKESDCSIAMASGSDAAKNVSSLVLLDSNFASMPKVVAEGRRSINNLERSAGLFLVKTFYNFLIAILFLIVPTVLPFAPKHLTLLGGVTIGIPSTVLALEPNKERVSGRFLPKIVVRTVPGVVTVMTGIVAIVLTTQFILPDLSVEQQQCLYFLATVFAGYLYVFKVCWPFNPLRAALYVFVVGLLVLCWMVPWPFIQTFFGLYKGITWPMWQVLLVTWSILIPVFVVSWLVERKYGLKVQQKLCNVADRKLQKKKAKANA